MARVCSVCSDERVRRIDMSLVAGASVRGTAARLGVSASALARHARAHLPAKLKTAAEAEELLDAGRLLRKIQALEGEARRLMRKAERRGDTRGAVMALRELAHGFELCGKALAAAPAAPKEAVRFVVDLSRDEGAEDVPDRLEADTAQAPAPAKSVRLLAAAPAPDVDDGDEGAEAGGGGRWEVT